MKIKNDKPARPKFHIIFPIDKVKDAKEYRALKEPYEDKEWKTC